MEIKWQDGVTVSEAVTFMDMVFRHIRENVVWDDSGDIYKNKSPFLKRKEPVREALNFTHWLNSFQISRTTLSVLSPFPGCDATECHAFLADSWNKAFSSD